MRVTVDREGPAGSAWLSALPAIVSEVAERWACTPDGEPLYGGVGIVVPVLRKTTEPAVLKVSFPHPENRYEPDALLAWGGRGAVLLHERDDDRYAMLLERAHPTTLAQAAQGDEVAAIAGSVSSRLAVPAPAGLPRLQDRAATWEEQLCQDARDFPEALPSRTVQAATATVRELALHQPDTLIHGDLNARNILAGAREPWLAVSTRRAGWATGRTTAARWPSPGRSSSPSRGTWPGGSTAPSTPSPVPPSSIGNAHGGGRSSVRSRPPTAAADEDFAAAVTEPNVLDSSCSSTSWRGSSPARDPTNTAAVRWPWQDFREAGRATVRR